MGLTAHLSNLREALREVLAARSTWTFRIAAASRAGINRGSSVTARIPE
jgi:hypothetical protein